jgi:hypothetical protein
MIGSGNFEMKDGSGPCGLNMRVLPFGCLTWFSKQEHLHLVYLLHRNGQTQEYHLHDIGSWVE